MGLNDANALHFEKLATSRHVVVTLEKLRENDTLKRIGSRPPTQCLHSTMELFLPKNKKKKKSFSCCG